MVDFGVYVAKHEVLLLLLLASEISRSSIDGGGGGTLQFVRQQECQLRAYNAPTLM